jgi:glycosyltransferase involved in cell wall biosynthesis
MRVGMDVSALHQTRAGTARHILGLLPRLETMPDLDLRRLSVSLPGAALDVAWYPLALPLVARRERVRVLHCPSFRAPLRAPMPVVVTVHDLAVLRDPSVFPRWSRTYSRATLKPILRNAARVIAVSEFTKRDVLELFGLPEGRVRVVPNAVDALFSPDGPAADGDYVLAVGTLEPRKNLARLDEAMRDIALELRIVGGLGWGDVIVSRGSNTKTYGYVSDDELARLYRGAACVAYPSLYEGFGMPVLEAMASGAPVVTSKDTAMAEVTDGAAVLVDPEDVESIAAGIREAIARRDELSRAGVERARAYTWDASAQATADVYRELA